MTIKELYKAIQSIKDEKEREFDRTCIVSVIIPHDVYELKGEITAYNKVLSLFKNSGVIEDE